MTAAKEPARGPAQLALCLGIVLLFVAGCQTPGASVELRINERFSRPSSAPEAPNDPQRVRLLAAIHENAGFVVSVRVLDAGIDRPTFEIARFTSPSGSLEASAIELFRAHRVPVDRFPGWIIRGTPTTLRDTAPLEVLVPLSAPEGGLPVKMRRGETYDFFVDIHVPKGTAAGNYRSRVELNSGGRLMAAGDVELEVLPFVLPDEGDVFAIAEVDHRALFNQFVGGDELSVDDWQDHPRRAAFERHFREVARLLRDHGLTPVLPDLSPLVTVSRGHDVQLNWSHYDAIVEPLLSGLAFEDRTPLRAWPLPLSRVFADATQSSIGGNTMPEGWVRSYVAQCVEHFLAKGWSSAAYALCPTGSSQRWESSAQLHSLANRMPYNGTNNSLATRRFPQDMRPFGWWNFEPTDWGAEAGIRLPPAQFFDPSALHDADRRESRIWWNADRPPFSGTTSFPASPADTRVLTWQAANYAAEALYLGPVNRWPGEFARPTPRDCLRFDPRCLLFPGEPFGLKSPVASMRLKALRRGLQDAAYARLLETHGLGHVVETLRKGLVGYAGADAYRTHFADGRRSGYPSSESPFELARRLMIEELLVATTGSHNPGAFDRTNLWRRFREEIGREELLIDGVRARLTASSPSLQTETEIHATLTHRNHQPISGAFHVDTASDRWTPGDESEVEAEVPANEPYRAVLTMESAFPVGDTHGHVTIPIAFESNQGQTLRTTASLSWLTAAGAPYPIRIDGDLADWPTTPGAAAGDFRLISGPAPNDSTGASSRPKRQTLAFTARDEKNLFVAFNVEVSPLADPPTARRNTVQLDDLIPVEDEDLVEVLIDPTNAGTRSPGDLRRIVVKRSGTQLAEVGISTDPPCGESRPWPVPLEVASSVHGGRWIVEMRIPIAAVEPDLRGPTVWGFNLTRWDAAAQEFSTWSHAVLNAYDPLSLGNLLVP